MIIPSNALQGLGGLLRVSVATSLSPPPATMASKGMEGGALFDPLGEHDLEILDV